MVRPLLCCALLALAACSRPQPPEKERPPVPQATGALREAIRAPLDKARGVEASVQARAAGQRAAIEAAAGD